MQSGTKRARLDNLPAHPSTSSFTSSPEPSLNSKSSASFRNVSACNRCRIRKNRCDQNLPACAPCEKAGLKCVGFDPITKKEIPRTYVYYLESRLNYLESLLSTNAIPFAPPQEFDLGSKPSNPATSVGSPAELIDGDASLNGPARPRSHVGTGSESGSDREYEEKQMIDKLVSNIGMVSVQGASDPRYLGSTSGISFARVVFAAVKSSVPGNNGGRKSSKITVGSVDATKETSMRDSFFGLQSKPNIKPAPFPEKELGSKLVDLYFEHANPQTPILHRGSFMGLFNSAYKTRDRQRSSRELYMLNIVFAIGAGIILEDSSMKSSPEVLSPLEEEVEASPKTKRQKTSSWQRQPEEYHASAMQHLESFLGSTLSADRLEGIGGGLEQLQAVLLLAGFALLRPVAPGLWYIVGVAVRLGVDLGLHHEDGFQIDGSSAVADMSPTRNTSGAHGINLKETGRQEWVRDLRRRLWWCVYSFDRLVGTCVGRPFGITDQVITAEWPSILDDKDITTEGFLVQSHDFNGPSYKRVSHHYLRLRLLQSEILQVLQHRQAKRAHEKRGNHGNQYMHSHLSSSFLQPFENSFHAWRKDVDRRLWEWKESAPLQEDTTVQFSVKFLELNYWQAVIMLYRQSLSVPPTFAGESGLHSDVESHLMPSTNDFENEVDIFLKVAEAGQRVIKLYKQLHRLSLVNYTYLATVHLFMAGECDQCVPVFPAYDHRYCIPLFSMALTDGAQSIDLIDKCPPAEACRDAFDRMSKATIQMCKTTTGFGSQVTFNRQMQDDSPLLPDDLDMYTPPKADHRGARPPPEFDYDLRDLFPEESQGMQGLSEIPGSWQATAKSNNNQLFSYPSPASTNSSVPNSNPAQMAPQQQRQYYDAELLDQNVSTMPMMLQRNGVPPSDGYDFAKNLDFDFLMTHDATTDDYTCDNGLNLGFEDGAQIPDFLGGFFFGDNSGYGEADAASGMKIDNAHRDIWTNSGGP